MAAQRKLYKNYNINKNYKNNKHNKSNMALTFRTSSTTTNILTTAARQNKRILTKNWHIVGNWQQFCIMLATLLLLAATTTVVDCEQHDGPSISQISPKSSSRLNAGDDGAFFMSTSTINAERIIADAAFSLDIKSAPQPQLSPQHEENETRQHLRVERSALPILNEHFPKSGPNNVHFPSDTQKEAAAGRYFQYNIKPTGTIDTLHSDSLEASQRTRAGKTLQSATAATSTATGSNSFLLKGGPRPLMSGSPINPTSSIASSMAATATAAMAAGAAPQNGRQNPSPDIQDIITGIVKLLNGNVNVHANTQGIRRPSASRINNRGPPRISEAQTLPIDYDMQKPSMGSSIRPPPYPFDRPERPFITGVPIPEQIVPYRPGFVSNRPPWHRNKPRPPITTTVGGGRRPIPQYKPLPASQMNPPPDEAPVPHQEQQPPPLPTQLAEDVVEFQNSDTDNDTLESAKPTDTTYDSEFSNEDDANTQYIEVSDHDSEAAAETGGADIKHDLQPPAPPVMTTTPQPSLPPPKKDEHKKKTNKHKASDKKKPTTGEYTTVFETSSVVNVVSSTYLPMPMQSADIDPSMDEIIFMTPSKTPELEIASQKASKTTNVAESSTVKSVGSSITTAPLWESEAVSEHTSRSTEIKATIIPTPSTTTFKPSTTTTTTATTTTTTTTTTASTLQPTNYQPRPGIVLDDPEFKPGGRPRPQQRPPPAQPPQRLPPTPPHHIQPTRQHLPPGYGEIFDVTLSAIQGPGSVGGSQQTINIKPYGAYGVSGGTGPQQQGDIIVSASGDDGFVSIDGKRTYINLFGDPTDAPAGVQLPTTPATAVPQLPDTSVSGGGVTPNTRHGVSNLAGTGYAVPETEVVELTPTQANSPKPAAQPQSPTTISGPTRPHYRPRTTQPPVRIDTCIVGDDSTCDQAQHERCKTENGVSSCHCRPGYSRRKHREPCRKVISFFLGLRVDRIYEHRIVWDKKLLDHSSEPYGQLSYESIRAIDSAMSMTPYSDEFMEAKVNNIYRGDPNLGGSGVFVNLTIKLDESVETLRPNLRSDVQKHLLGVIHRRNNNIGNSVLYVSTPDGSISALNDLDECQSEELNDCHPSATCANSWGSFRCVCETGLRDPWADQPQRAGRECQACSDAYCNNRGTCSYNDEGAQICACDASHYGGQCEIDGEVLGVAIGASVAAVIIIVLTLVCLIMWSRRWQREQKNAMGSPVFGYMNTAPLKSAATMAQPGYQVTLEDRMRWAQIADVMAQTNNHYGAEPIGPTRPSSAMFAYPNLQAMGMGTMGGMSMQSTMQMHQNANLPPVPLPRRLGLGSRSNHGMRALENSSSSEEEDRTDLLGRNFQVPRPKSRSNGSIANQSGIYYDVDYEPSGNGIGNTSVDHLYGSQNQSSSHSHSHSQVHSHVHSGNNHIPGPQGIPMSTYTSGRAPSSYYMK